MSVAVESAPVATKKPTKRTASDAGLQPGVPAAPSGRGAGVGIAPVAEIPPGLPMPALPGTVPPHAVPPIAVMQPQLSADPRLYAPPPVPAPPPFARGAPMVPTVPPMPSFPHGGPPPNAMGMPPPPQVAYGRGMVSQKSFSVIDLFCYLFCNQIILTPCTHYIAVLLLTSRNVCKNNI